MKVTKENILEAWAKEPEDKNHFLTLEGDSAILYVHLPYPDLSADDISNSLAWLQYFNVDGENTICITKNTSYSGIISLSSSSLTAEKSSVIDSYFDDVAVYGGDNKTDSYFESENSHLRSMTIRGKENKIKNSRLNHLNVGDVQIYLSSITDKGSFNRGSINSSTIARSEINSEKLSFSNKNINGANTSAYMFNGEYLSINDGFGELTAVMEINRKTVFYNNKTYNLGVWEEQFINKEQNLFIKMMNQKKLEMMNMFFDSLAFK